MEFIAVYYLCGWYDCLLDETEKCVMNPSNDVYSKLFSTVTTSSAFNDTDCQNSAATGRWNFSFEIADIMRSLALKMLQEDYAQENNRVCREELYAFRRLFFMFVRCR